MKGILLAGGSGSRLYPLTLSISKQLLPVYDKPTLAYPLSILMLAGIREIAIISTPRDLPRIREMLGDGSQIGLQLSYLVQEEPKGIAQALLIAEDFLNKSPCCLILGDNVFYGHDVTQQVRQAAKLTSGACVFGYHVHDPERYGVVEFDSNKKVLSLEEKPKNPKSNVAVTGLYFYDSQASAFARRLQPSARGELEITDLNRMYLERGELRLEIFGRGIAWLDTGTPESLLEASLFVQTIEKRQGLKIACLEEIAYQQEWISRAQLMSLVDSFPNCSYRDYLKRIASSGSFSSHAKQ